jgi:O-acetyl-ADP-ribose deacetylase (regulator of RNase III)
MFIRKVGSKVMSLVRGDITQSDVDAFVYDITEDCKLGSGYGGAIMMRGGKVIQEELANIGKCKTGEAVVTTAGDLTASFIIHVNGPKFHEPDTAAKLERATRAALQRAKEKGLKRVAFPPIGTGLYQVPLDLCADVMVKTVESHLSSDTSLEEVRFVAGDSREFAPLQARLGKGS